MSNQQRPQVYPKLTPLSPDAVHKGFFSEVGTELLQQLHYQVVEHALLPRVPQVVRDNWLRTPGLAGYLEIIFSYDGRTFTYYHAFAQGMDVSERILLWLLQGMFEDFRTREDYPDRWMQYPDMAWLGYLEYNKVMNPERRFPGAEQADQTLGGKETEAEMKVYFAQIDYELAGFKALVGEEVYQQLLKTESDL